ncbi:MAG: hypothetical protein MJE77_09170 [Proteobacteria bacterium]|nr:hypothetical protein [Pseudomonadota bacterium]
MSLGWHQFRAPADVVFGVPRRRERDVTFRRDGHVMCGHDAVHIAKGGLHGRVTWTVPSPAENAGNRDFVPEQQRRATGNGESG